MARKLRYVPEGGALVEVTCRTLHGRLLLRPSTELNEIVAGILGRAQRLYPLQLVSYVFMSNHYHCLVWVEDARRLARFFGYFNSKLARDVSRLTGWTGKIWDRRYQAIVISDEETPRWTGSATSSPTVPRRIWWRRRRIGRGPTASGSSWEAIN